MKKLLFVGFLLIFCLSGFGILNAEAQKKNKSSKSKEEERIKELQKQALAQVEKELEENKPSKVYVFVGEKIEVVEFKPELKQGEIPFDLAFKAKYKIIQNVYGDYQGEFIEFEAYDHHGYPAFADYKNVLLFVSEYKGKLYHETSIF